MRGLGRQLQAVNVKRPDDHIPLMVELRYLRETAPPIARSERLDRDVIMLCATKGFRRKEFVTSLTAELDKLPLRDLDRLPDAA